MSATLTQSRPIEPRVTEIATPEADDGANSAPPSGYWRISARGNTTLSEQVSDMIRGQGARFAAAASRRAMKSMSSRPRDDAETR